MDFMCLSYVFRVCLFDIRIEFEHAVLMFPLFIVAVVCSQQSKILHEELSTHVHITHHMVFMRVG